jgi:3-oxoacyl-[acyl-carrier-protein] synthase II
MEERDVVITGTGLLTPLGSGCNVNWQRVRAEETGLSLGSFAGNPDHLQCWGRIDEAPLPADLPPKLTGQVKFLNRSAIFGFLASHEAVTHAGFPLEQVPPGRRALYIASGDYTKVGYEFMYPAVKDAVKEGHFDHARLNSAALDKVNPFFLLESLQNNLFSFLSASFEFMGPNTSLSSLSPWGGQSIELAVRSIRQDKADIALAVGYGSWINEVPLFELDRIGILSRCRSGVNSFRPFDRRRDGFIPGEGGAALFLEAYGQAKRRGARILGSIRGTANYNEFIPEKGFAVAEKVSSRSMELALQDAGCNPEMLGFIIAHGSGTQKGDRSELVSFATLLDEGRINVPICGMKPYTGHLGAASDIGEVILGIRAASEGIVPATLNFNETEQGFGSLKLSANEQQCRTGLFMSVSYGIGGQSSSIVVEIPSAGLAPALGEVR